MNWPYWINLWFHPILADRSNCDLSTVSHATSWSICWLNLVDQRSLSLLTSNLKLERYTILVWLLNLNKIIIKSLLNHILLNKLCFLLIQCQVFSRISCCLISPVLQNWSNVLLGDRKSLKVLSKNLRSAYIRCCLSTLSMSSHITIQI